MSPATRLGDAPARQYPRCPGQGWPPWSPRRSRGGGNGGRARWWARAWPLGSRHHRGPACRLGEIKPRVPPCHACEAPEVIGPGSRRQSLAKQLVLEPEGGRRGPRERQLIHKRLLAKVPRELGHARVEVRARLGEIKGGGRLLALQAQFKVATLAQHFTPDGRIAYPHPPDTGQLVRVLSERILPLGLGRVVDGV